MNASLCCCCKVPSPPDAEEVQQGGDERKEEVKGEEQAVKEERADGLVKRQDSEMSGASDWLGSEEVERRGDWPSERVCHTHERAIPIQETVEALDITEEGKRENTQGQNIDINKLENKNRILICRYRWISLSLSQEWRLCSAIWSCILSALWNFSIPPCLCVKSAAMTGRDSCRKSLRCMKCLYNIF